jgi:molybdopterin-guanine dinucleotide biosynthesis protein A
MLNSITGVVLAGGKSSRMGSNKALLPFGRVPLIEHVAGILTTIFERVVLSVASPDDFSQIALPRIVDHYPETGPIGGITSVLESGESKIFCAACDMPFLNPKLIKFLCGFPDCDAVIPVWHQKLEVLHAIYGNELLTSFQNHIVEGRYRIADSLLEAHIRFVGEEEIRNIDPRGDSFRNVNTPEDYAGLNRKN